MASDRMHRRSRLRGVWTTSARVGLGFGVLPQEPSISGLAGDLGLRNPGFTGVLTALPGPLLGDCWDMATQT